MKSIYIPFIKSIEEMDPKAMENAIEEKGAKAFIDQNNWPDQFPYTPVAAVTVARSETHLCLMYSVRGLDLRAKALQDQGRSWEDSCCEFFVDHPSDGTYYNFELTCIGSLLASKRTGRNDPANLPDEALARIIRHSSLERKEYDISGNVFSWNVGMCIPFELIGVDPDNLPASLRVNFYKCADKTAHPHFLSWNPVGTPSPDFHRPEFFGEIRF
ncbi:MAG: carbohydrate-binding family 9-like protein [Candidatus Cryptobacteroides sp.]